MTAKNLCSHPSIVVAILMVLAGAGPLMAGTIFVSTSGDDENDGTSWDMAKQTVQAGLSAAVPEDQVWVASGTYVERITLVDGIELYGGFAGTETDLAQRDWMANLTILDGDGAGSVVRAFSNVTTSSRIDGFFILNGSTSGSGGGISCLGGSPTISNNIIYANSASSGGGISCSGGAPMIEGNFIVYNSAASYGGAIHCSNSSPMISDNTIYANSATSGGGISCSSDSSPMIANNTITDNIASGTNSYGGAIYCGSSSPTITDNTISRNIVAGSSSSYGGAIYCSSSNPTITSNTITSNGVTGTNSYGGGVYCSSSSPAISNNTIAGNTASYGGGIYCYLSGPTITNNTITGNSVSGGNSYGGGICCNSSSPTIANNAITANSASYVGGGLYCTSGSPVIANNTITANGASQNGGGIYCGSGSPTIANTIVAFNSSGIYQTKTGTPSLRYNCVYGNTAYDYSGLADPTGTNGNISADPKFAGITYGNLHIQPDSPCVDAGDDAATQPDGLDIDGQSRITGAQVDIGADESEGTVWPEGPYGIIRVSPDGDDSNDGSSWELAKQTVQAGIEAASMLGGEVWVQAGTYEERITLPPFVYLYGGFSGTESDRSERDWIANVTILDGQQGGSVVTARAGDRVSAIDGFTIRNGSSTSGGGIYCYLSGPTILNNTIIANTVTSTYGSGGGIACSGGSPLIMKNTITTNTASYAGGAISCSGGSPTIVSNTIAGNIAYGNTGGGAIYCVGGSARIVDNAITGNSASYAGGGIFCSGGSPIIANNAFAANSATYAGGAISCSSGSPIITNNTIAGNSAYNGGGIDCGSTSPTITNNTVTANSAYNGGGIYCGSGSPMIANTIVAFNSSGIYQTKTGTPSLRYNCVYGNTAYDYSGLADPTGTNGNISADPKFAGIAYGNLHIQPDSPCVDAGDDAATQPDGLDIDGQSRITGAQVDIGADESDGTVWPEGPYGIIRVSPDGDDSNDGSSWELAKQTVQAGIEAASMLGGEVWVQAGTYEERIILPPFVYLYGGFSGTESDRSERDWMANVTILDGQQSGSVVTARAGDRVSAIDGFTIRNGSSTSNIGGGIFCSYASPLITNNTVTGNSASSYGGGISCNSSSPVILNNTITGNSASARGGGVYCYNSSSPVISNNTISGNAAGSGGGIYCASSPVISNNIVAFNSSGLCNSGGTPTLRNNCVYNPDGADYTGLVAGTGDISLDPLFVSTETGDYHLASASPCIDAGYNAAVPSGFLLDQDGRVRFYDDLGTEDCQWAPDTCGTAPIVDIGAYEFVPVVPGDFDRDGDVDMDDFATLHACASGPAVPYTGDCAKADFDGDNDVDQGDFGVFQRCYSGADKPGDPNCAN